METKFQLLEHTADIGFEAIGETREEAIENATVALVTLITNPETIKNITSKEITVEADDWLQLIVRYLGEVLYLIDAESFLPREAKITIPDESLLKLTARLVGEVRNQTHEIRTDVKAITYHQLLFEQRNQHYYIRVFVDI